MMKQILMAGSATMALVLAMPAAAQTAPASAAPAADAASPEASDPGDIIVTAQKRSERLQDVPVAVSVLSGESLARQNVVNLENVQYAVPTLNIRKSGAAINQSLYLRGIGTQSSSIAFEPSVSTVLDGVVLSRAAEAFTDLVDIDRIEVLRGPQGTLFGKNTSAGVINIVSKQPGDQLGGTIEGGYYFGNGTEYKVRAAIDAPLSDKIKTRLTGFYGTYDGNIFNDAANVNRRVNGYEHYGFRGIVAAQVSDTLKFTLIGDWRKSNDDCCAEVISAPARNADGSVYQAFLDRAAIALPPIAGYDGRTVRQNLVTRSLETSWGVSLQGDLELGDYTVTSITSYRSYDDREIRDGDFLDRIYVGISQSHDDGPQVGDTFTQEIRLTSPAKQTLAFVLGAYYSLADSKRTFTRSNIACSASTLPSLGALTPCSTSPGASTLTFPIGIANYGSTFENVAVFGQATLNLADNFRLIGGIRFTYDNDKGFFIRTTPVPGASNPPFDDGVYNGGLGGGTPNGIPFRQYTSSTNLSGKIGAQYDITRNNTAYFTYSRGYKGPAFNLFFNLNPNGTPVIAPETADSFEFGLKNSFLGGKLVFNIAAYYALYHNFQANNPDFVLGTRVTRFTNAGEVSTRGFEVDALFRPVRDLNISAGLAYTDAHVDQFRLPPGANPADLVPNGTPLSYAPKWKGSISGDYRIRTGGPVDVKLGAQGSFTSSQLSLFVGNALGRQYGTIKPYGLVDLSVGITTPNDKYQLTFVVKNVFDQSFAAAIGDGGPLSGGNTGTSSFRYLIPREADRYFGLTGKINF